MCLHAMASVLTWVAVLTRALLLASLLAVAVQSAGCGTLRDRRDAPWDPPRQGQLFEQIPAWDRSDQQCGDWSNGQVPRC